MDYTMEFFYIIVRYKLWFLANKKIDGLCELSGKMNAKNQLICGSYCARSWISHTRKKYHQNWLNSPLIALFPFLMNLSIKLWPSWQSITYFSIYTVMPPLLAFWIHLPCICILLTDTQIHRNNNFYLKIQRNHPKEINRHPTLVESKGINFLVI